MKKTIWDTFAPIYERAMKSQKNIYDFLYRQISIASFDKTVLELATGPGMIARHIAHSAFAMGRCSFSIVTSMSLPSNPFGFPKLSVNDIFPFLYHSKVAQRSFIFGRSFAKSQPPNECFFISSLKLCSSTKRIPSHKSAIS